jgi:predicted RNase H-like HicB family nuclease
VVYYVGILDVGSNGVWGIRIPDVPGCHGGGDSPEAALADAIDALREVGAHHASKGAALGSPRSALEILRDKGAGNDPARGETLVMVPLLLDQARPVKANISLDAGLLEAIDDEAERRGLTRSAFLASAALDKIVDGAGAENRAKRPVAIRSRIKNPTTAAVADRTGRSSRKRKQRPA